MFTPNQRPESYSLNVHFNGLSHLYFYVKGEERKMLEDQPKMMFFTPFGDRGDIILNHFIWFRIACCRSLTCSRVLMRSHGRSFGVNLRPQRSGGTKSE